MKDFILKYKMFLLILIITIFSILLITQSLAMTEYEKIDYNLGIVNTDYLNMRSGSNINFDAIDLLTKNEYVRIFGRINDWYIVQNEEDKIGTVHVNYITPVQEEKASATNTEIIQENSLLTEDENYLLELINAERRKHNLNDLKIDKELQNIAILKANDLVNNNYFSHTSKTYGSPFDMLKQYNITYKTASENIAGNPNIDAALSSWLNSESHKKNILSNDYNYTGLAIVDSIAYGNIIVQFFIGR
jgi:uncharacterized YkwD family protein